MTQNPTQIDTWSWTAISKNWLQRFAKKQQDPDPLEEQQRIIERALRFDSLIVNPAWNRDILPHMVDIVNREMMDAAHCDPAMPEKKLNHVVRWDAMRELLDSVQGYIEEQRELRDRLLKSEETNA